MKEETVMTCKHRAMEKVRNAICILQSVENEPGIEFSLKIVKKLLQSVYDSDLDLIDSDGTIREDWYDAFIGGH